MTRGEEVRLLDERSNEKSLNLRRPDIKYE